MRGVERQFGMVEKGFCDAKCYKDATAVQQQLARGGGGGGAGGTAGAPTVSRAGSHEVFFIVPDGVTEGMQVRGRMAHSVG